VDLTARNTGLQHLADLLRTQNGAKADAIIPARKLRATPEGQVVIADTEPLVDESGVTDMNGTYSLTDTALRHFAERFEIDTRYARKLADRRPDILADNINGWIHGGEDYPADKRSFTVRTFHRPEDDGGNLFRGLLSDKFSITDNLDVLAAVLQGVQQAGLADGVKVDGCDLSESRMRVRVVVPTAQIAAPILFAGYRSPFAGHGAEVRVGTGGDWDLDAARDAARHEHLGFESGQEPILFAGFEFGNGELGDGSTYVVPRAVALVCRNGLTLPLDVARKTHVGERLDEGVIDWSSTTRRKALELITSKAADAAARFSSVEFWQERVDALEAKAGKTVSDPDKTIKAVSKALRFTEDEQDSILRMFIKGGQMTAGGVLNAVTATAQTVADPEQAATLERVAVKVLDLV
jgi:hypothetical protein